METDAVIDHGEAAARELCGADKCSADIFAGLGGGKRQTAFGGHGLADAGHLRTLQIGDKSFDTRIRPSSSRTAWPTFTRLCLRRSIALATSRPNPVLASVVRLGEASSRSSRLAAAPL